MDIVIEEGSEVSDFLYGISKDYHRMLVSELYQNNSYLQEVQEDYEKLFPCSFLTFPDLEGNPTQYKFISYGLGFMDFDLLEAAFKTITKEFIKIIPPSSVVIFRKNITISKLYDKRYSIQFRAVSINKSILSCKDKTKMSELKLAGSDKEEALYFF